MKALRSLQFTWRIRRALGSQAFLKSCPLKLDMGEIIDDISAILGQTEERRMTASDVYVLLFPPFCDLLERYASSRLFIVRTW